MYSARPRQAARFKNCRDDTCVGGTGKHVGESKIKTGDVVEFSEQKPLYVRFNKDRAYDYKDLHIIDDKTVDYRTLHNVLVSWKIHISNLRVR